MGVHCRNCAFTRAHLSGRHNHKKEMSLLVHEEFPLYENTQKNNYRNVSETLHWTRNGVYILVCLRVTRLRWQKLSDSLQIWRKCLLCENNCIIFVVRNIAQIARVHWCTKISYALLRMQENTLYFYLCACEAAAVSEIKLFAWNLPQMFVLCEISYMVFSVHCSNSSCTGIHKTIYNTAYRGNIFKMSFSIVIENKI